MFSVRSLLLSYLILGGWLVSVCSLGTNSSACIKRCFVVLVCRVALASFTEYPPAWFAGEYVFAYVLNVDSVDWPWLGLPPLTASFRSLSTPALYSTTEQRTLQYTTQPHATLDILYKTEGTCALGAVLLRVRCVVPVSVCLADPTAQVLSRVVRCGTWALCRRRL